MSRRGAISLVLTWLVLVTGCGPSAPSGANQRDVVRPALGFALDVPDGWTWRDLAGDVVLEAVRRPGGAAQPAASQQQTAPRPDRRSAPVLHVVVIDREGLTLDEWTDYAIRDSRQLQSDLEVVSRDKTQLTDGREALRVILKNPRSVEPLIQRMLLTATKSKAYALILTAPEGELAAAESATQKCFDSFVVW